MSRLILPMTMAIFAAPFMAALADARKDVRFIEGWDNHEGAGTSKSANIVNSGSRDKDWAACHDKYAQLRYGPPKKLANGVRWRLAIDQRTEVGMPRIVWMPINTRKDIANRLLDTVHGAAMLFSDTRRKKSSLFACGALWRRIPYGYPQKPEQGTCGT